MTTEHVGIRSCRVWTSCAVAVLAIAMGNMAFAQTSPPAGYPPPGYGQQPYAQPGYGPQPGYQGYPPPGYAQPGYPQPGYAPVAYAPAPPPSVPPYRRGFLAMPYLGINIPVGDASDAFDMGFRMGGLFGGHVSPQISLNGEFTLDVFNPKGVPSGYDVTAVAADFAFSPLFHALGDKLDLVIGPKLGFFGFAMGIKDPSGTSMLDESASGMVYGFNLGVFGAVGNMAIGGLLSYTGRHATRVCVTMEGYPEQCDDNPGGDDLKNMSVTGAILF